MKRIIALIILVAVCMTCVACSVIGNNDSQSDSSKKEKICYPNKGSISFYDCQLL